MWKFEDPDGAEHAASILKGVEAERLIKVLDHAVLTWPAGKSRPTLKRTHDATWHDTGWGALWGLLVGGLFFMPLLGVAAGAGIGAVLQATDGVGIGKDELEAIRTQMTEGTSALMVITDEGNLDRVGERFHGMHWTLVDTNLTAPERRLLLETFGGG
ncbi:MAG TPA: DUF1269 domain-containing protein [Jatrophihabitans sp.]|nr:DUF1269 domain-containing protein [Jatrophihabitans sp.]